MKKNLISIIILALLVVNIALTSVMMFSVMNTNQKTTRLVGDIASALELEFSDPSGQEQQAEVSIADTATYKFADPLTIRLKDSGKDGQEDGKEHSKEHYFITNVSFSMNTKDKAYKKYGETIAEQDDLLKSSVYTVISDYTLEELRADNNEKAAQDILEQIQAMYDSKFIFKVNFIDFMYQ